MLIFYLKKALLLRLAVLFSVIFFTVSSLLAQNSVNTAGKSATGSGGTATYSIGQVVYTTNTGSTGTTAQGVQHAIEIYTTRIENEVLDIDVLVFPNPSSDQLTLQASDNLGDHCSWSLFDLQGKLMASKLIEGQQNSIATALYPSGTYFLQILNQKQTAIKSFKIIKN